MIASWCKVTSLRCKMMWKDLKCKKTWMLKERESVSPC